MNLDESRVYANERFIDILQPVLDAAGENKEIDAEKVNADVEALKEEIEEKTGERVKMFYVNPLPYGFYDVTTVFESDEEAKEDAPEFTPG